MGRDLEEGLSLAGKLEKAEDEPELEGLAGTGSGSLLTGAMVGGRAGAGRVGRNSGEAGVGGAARWGAGAAWREGTACLGAPIGWRDWTAAGAGRRAGTEGACLIGAGACAAGAGAGWRAVKVGKDCCCCCCCCCCWKAGCLGRGAGVMGWSSCWPRNWLASWTGGWGWGLLPLARFWTTRLLWSSLTMLPERTSCKKKIHGYVNFILVS